jgi:hypothetical protein
MEYCVVIGFCTLKKTKTKDIHIELESVYVPEVFARPTMKNGGNAFSKGELICLMNPGLKGG